MALPHEKKCSNVLLLQDPNADTEWNDALRRHGIIPQKEKELTEDDIIGLVEQTVQQKASGKRECEDHI